MSNTNVPDASLKELTAIRILRLNGVANGFLLGSVAALAIFVSTNWLVIKGGDVVGPHLGLLSQYFTGYRVSFAGSLVGAAYGLISGFVIGYIISRIYNVIASLSEHRVARRAS